MTMAMSRRIVTCARTAEEHLVQTMRKGRAGNLNNGAGARGRLNITTTTMDNHAGLNEALSL